MNLDQFKTLSKKFENKNFEKDNSLIDKTLFYSSWFGNLLSIIFAFFFINSLVGQAAVHFAGQNVILPVFIIAFLTMFELLKRYIFGNLVTNILINPINAKVIASIAFALILIFSSFYLSMSGAQHYVNKSEVIESNTDSIITNQTKAIDSLTTIEITKVEAKIQYVYNAAQERKRTALTRDEVKDVKQWEEDIKHLKTEKETKIKAISKDVVEDKKKQTEKSESSQFAFLILSGFIELIILIGVGFRQYYSYACYLQMKERIQGDPIYKKLDLYKQMLQTIYNNGRVSVNSELPSMNRLAELINAKSKIKINSATIKEFLSIAQHLEIIYTSGKKKCIQVPYDKALEKINNYIPLDNE